MIMILMICNVKSWSTLNIHWHAGIHPQNDNVQIRFSKKFSQQMAVRFLTKFIMKLANPLKDKMIKVT